MPEQPQRRPPGGLAVHFSSKTDQWETPAAFFARVEARFGPFDLDVCALPENAQCARYFTPEVDGLAQAWSGVCWMNPPYGRAIAAWVQKAWESAQNSGATVVCLVPARTDTRWWHRYAMRAAEIYLVSGRLRFGGAPHGAPFPSALVVFRPPVPEGEASPLRVSVF